MKKRLLWNSTNADTTLAATTASLAGALEPPTNERSLMARGGWTKLEVALANGALCTSQKLEPKKKGKTMLCTICFCLLRS
jgi:hypothetical protein